MARNASWYGTTLMDCVPDLPAAQPGHFDVADLLRFVGDVNPLG